MSITPVDRAPAPVPAGVVRRPARLGEVLPAAARGDAEVAADLARAVATEAALMAYRVEQVLELAPPGITEHPHPPPDRPPDPDEPSPF